jgi:hypothetical protein
VLPVKFLEIFDGLGGGKWLEVFDDRRMFASVNESAFAVFILQLRVGAGFD